MGSGIRRRRTVTCEGCGQTVTARTRAKRFCSLGCYRSSPRPERKRGQNGTCLVCGAAIYIRPSEPGRKFCSVAHLNQWQARTKIHYTCSICGKGFTWSPSRKNVRYCSLACRDADPEVRKRLISMTAHQQFTSPNGLELLGYSLLDRLDIPYERQYVIAGKFCVDAYVPSLELVVQFDGDYWHGHPARYPIPDARQRRRMRHDRSQDAYMATMGLRVARFWESDLRERPDEVMAELRRLAARSARTRAAHRSGQPAA